uniref:Fatty acid hydroxylase domain-containing protein n=1 Tax=Toxocara canis TaxID=6265 RepID=A0A183U3Y5_TOXCA
LGPLEYILNTPSHHRVHHGRNPYCIDKNYGGTLIIWDRLFGTFEWERDSERPIYGAVDNVKTFDQLYLQLAEKLTKEEREQATITYPEEELISAVQERQLQECRKSNLAVVKAPDGADGAKTKTGVVLRKSALSVGVGNNNRNHSYSHSYGNDTGDDNNLFSIASTPIRSGPGCVITTCISHLDQRDQKLFGWC